ncbi:MAG: hypothetical protein M3Q19_00015 [Pseudomonadota bacterium]|nr:hypothetical protein [Pseudomonadota bacterium]
MPTALVPKFGRREIWKILKTAKRSEAETLHLKEAAYWAAAFAEAERPDNNGTALPSPGQPLTNAQVAVLAGQFFSRAKAQLDLSARGPADLEPEEAANVAADLEWQLSTLQSWKNPDAHPLVEEAKQQALGSTASAPGEEGADDLLAERLRRAPRATGCTAVGAASRRLPGQGRRQIFSQWSWHASGNSVGGARWSNPRGLPQVPPPSKETGVEGI